MTEKRPSGHRRIPHFANLQAKAEFWDTHDTADYESEFDPVRAKVANPLSEGLTVRLDPDTLIELRSVASEQGVGPTTLTRMWIREHLRRRK